MSYSPHLGLAESVVADGFDRHESAVGELIAEARHREIDEVLVEILADRSVPRVVRERALGRVIVAVENPSRASGGGRPRLVSYSDGGAPDQIVDVFERACA